ncbi:hypothetical protein DLREEDagrD3_10320 [Denitratisoma sp. agr-D3]
MNLVLVPPLGLCRVAPRLAPYFLAVRQESRQRIAPCCPGPAGFPPSGGFTGLAAKLAYGSNNAARIPRGNHLRSAGQKGFDFLRGKRTAHPRSSRIPSVEPVMQRGKWGFPGLLSEPQASLQDRPFHALQRRVARRAETAGNVSLPTFLSFDTKVGRQPGRDPAKPPRSP